MEIAAVELVRYHDAAVGIVEDDFNVGVQRSTVDPFVHEIVPTIGR